MSWSEVAKLNDLAIDTAKQVEVNGEAVCLVRNQKGVFAVADACTHGAASLAEGAVTDRGIECWLHGAVFDLETGEALTPPATKAVEVFEVKVDGDGDDAIVLVSV
jgi:3-phenylpropionate/trans-cinnamate dioxygenase ferredoxin component